MFTLSLESGICFSLPNISILETEEMSDGEDPWALSPHTLSGDAGEAQSDASLYKVK